MARQLTKNAKKESWHSFTSSINKNTTSTTVWKSINSICGKPRQGKIKMINVDNQNITTIEGIASALGKQISNTSSSSNYTISFLRHKISIENPLRLQDNNNFEAYNTTLTYVELEHALSTCKGSSPGPDRIT